MVEFIFFFSIFLIFFAYLGYPLTLAALKPFKGRKVKKTPFFPKVTLIITAYNEEKKIAQKIENTLKLDYPREKLQVIVASDGSTDRTDELVLQSKSSGVELLRINDRGGKERAQKAAVEVAAGDVIIFSDTATILDPEGLQEIVSNFADPSVGCVSSEDRLIGRDGAPSGEGFYVRYEMWLRRLESTVYSLVGLSGSFFAARQIVCRDFSDRMPSDFRIVLNSIKLGLRAVTDPNAHGYYDDVADQKREFDRKVRTIIRGITVFFGHLEFVNVFRYGFFSYQYLCHKLLRWLVPLCLISTFMANLLLAGKSIFFFLFVIAQLIFYALAFWGWKKSPPPAGRMLKVPVYFLLANISILVAWYNYLRGQRVVAWTPSKR